MTQAPQSRSYAAILTALDVETKAVLYHLGGWVEEIVQGTVFYKGRFEAWDVVIAEVGAGNSRAAVIAERAIQHFRPIVALFVGIAGGVKDVVIGDVVVGNKIYGYESGKDEADSFRTRPDIQNTAHSIEQRARVLLKTSNWTKRLNKANNHADPQIFVGPIAAGEKVVASKFSVTARFLKTNYSDALAVEMEGRGFLEGIHINSSVEGGVVRGISDLLSGKAAADKAGAQRRAADAASAVAFEILSGLKGSSTKSPESEGLDIMCMQSVGLERGGINDGLTVEGRDRLAPSAGSQRRSSCLQLPDGRRLDLVQLPACRDIPFAQVYICLRPIGTDLVNWCLGRTEDALGKDQRAVDVSREEVGRVIAYLARHLGRDDLRLPTAEELMVAWGAGGPILAAPAVVGTRRGHEPHRANAWGVLVPSTGCSEWIDGSERPDGSNAIRLDGSGSTSVCRQLRLDPLQGWPYLGFRLVASNPI